MWKWIAQIHLETAIKMMEEGTLYISSGSCIGLV